MKHNWKVGDAYTTNEGGEHLRYYGIITEVSDQYASGFEISYSLKRNTFYGLQLEATRLVSDLIPLVPEYARLEQLDQTINEIYATVEKVQGPICTNPPDSCMPGCPLHGPIDAWEGFNSNISYK